MSKLEYFVRETIKMMRRRLRALALPAVLVIGALPFTACTYAQRGAGIGAVGGGILGAVIGHQSDHRTEGALIGATAGALAGALAGDGIDEYKDRKKAQQDAAREDDLRQRVDQLEEENRYLRDGEGAAPGPAAPDTGMPPPPSTPDGQVSVPTAPGTPGAVPPPRTRVVRYLKKRIAVAPVDIRIRAAGVESYSQQLRAMLITELNKSNRFIVVERENLNDILDEQDLAASGRIAKGTGPQSGQLMGAQLMIRPQITDFEDQSSEGRNIGVGPVDFGRASNTVRVGMDVRIYNTETGVVVASENVSAEKVSSNQDFSIQTGLFRWDDAKSQNSTLGHVTRDLVQEAIDRIVRQSEKIRWSASVMKEAEGKVYFNGGSEVGVRVGDKFRVVSVGEKLRDPDTGEVLATEEEPVATIEVQQVEPKYSVGYVTEAMGTVKRLDKVILP